MLHHAGFLVHQAASGAEGVEAVRNTILSSSLWTVDLPGFDGFEAARIIRTFSEAYLIMVSKFTAEEDVLMGLAAAAHDCLGKAFRQHRFRARIGAMLRSPEYGFQGCLF